jgi:tetratricopeptide (TPR) repeat protein
MNKKAEALSEFARAISLEPKNFLAYVYTAGIRDEQGDYDGAEKDYAVLVKLNPEYYFAWEGLGVIRMRKGKWADARDAFLQAYKYAPKENGYALLAAANWMRTAKQRDPKQKEFLASVLKPVAKDTLEWYIIRLYHDMNGDVPVAGRVDREKSPIIKSRMAYYLALYYEIVGSPVLADQYYTVVRDLDQKAVPEWRLNEWAISQRNLAIK